MTGKTTISIRKGKKGPILMDEVEYKDVAKEIAAKKIDNLAEIIGNSKAKAARSVLLGISKEIAPGMWVKADVYAGCELSCDQSDLGIEEGNELAGDLARKWAIEEFDRAGKFIDSMKP